MSAPTVRPRAGLGAMHFLIGVVALVIGVAVGGLGPRSEIHALRAQIDEMGECEPGSNVGTEIANVFRGRPWDGDEPPRKVTRFAPDAGPVDPVEGDAPVPEPVEEEHEGIQITFGDDGTEPENLEQGLDMAREAMELRYAQARAALIEDANPSEEQLDRIDGSMRRMNDSLMGLATDLVDQMAGQEEPSRRDTMLYAAETLDVVLSAEDELRSILSEDQVSALQDESLDPLSYVDPAIVDVLAQLDRSGRGSQR
ncbi:MAG: hypothetical protein R3F61_06375 [Myxococcota bacterium]